MSVMLKRPTNTEKKTGASLEECSCGYHYIWNSNHCCYTAVCNNFFILSDRKALGNASQNTLLSPDSSHVATSCHFPVEQCGTGTRPLNLQSRSDIHTVFLFSVIKFCFQGHWHSSPDVEEWDFALAFWMSCTLA